MNCKTDALDPFEDTLLAHYGTVGGSNALHATCSEGDELPRAGETINDKYLIVQRLGAGGMGVVFEAVHLKLEQRVALKFPRASALDAPGARARFHLEAQVSGRVRGPHVAHVLDVDSYNGTPFMVMEFLEGCDLERELRERGRLSIEEAVDWILQACAAVAAAHSARVVHRDLKPSNLFMTIENGRKVVKVLDFGIAKLRGDTAEANASPVLVGTPIYMSPEQVRSSADVDERTDIWALGIVLFELLAGAPPFGGTTTAAIAAIVADSCPSLRTHRSDVSDALDEVIRTALAKDREHRFSSVEAFAAALIPFASDDGVSGPYSHRPSAAAVEAASVAMRRSRSRGDSASQTAKRSGVIPLLSRRAFRRNVFRWWTAGVGVAVAIGSAVTWANVRVDKSDDQAPLAIVTSDESNATVKSESGSAVSHPRSCPDVAVSPHPIHARTRSSTSAQSGHSALSADTAKSPRRVRARGDLYL